MLEKIILTMFNKVFFQRLFYYQIHFVFAPKLYMPNRNKNMAILQ